MTETDIARCRRGMTQLDIFGAPRPAVIEEAIALIQADRTNALRKNYLGMKNYASFGDQREDHTYGMGPKHGTIVFSIGRTAKMRERPETVTTFDDDAIYLLEAYRDFGTKPVKRHDNSAEMLALCDVIRRYDGVSVQQAILAGLLHGATIESHV